VHHEMRAGPAMRTVVGVRVPGVEGEVMSRVWVHLSGRDRVEPFRRLAVSHPDLRPKLARPAADREGFEMRVFAVCAAFPDFEPNSAGQRPGAIQAPSRLRKNPLACEFGRGSDLLNERGSAPRFARMGRMPA
jgi:hypothetical protein